MKANIPLAAKVGTKTMRVLSDGQWVEVPVLPYYRKMGQLRSDLHRANLMSLAYGGLRPRAYRTVIRQIRRDNRY